MNKGKGIDEQMLAPCGVNCMVCSAHLRGKKTCGGCRAKTGAIRASCKNCNKRACAKEKGVLLCAQCGDFPCKWIKYLDKSYLMRYGISLIQNGVAADRMGAKDFLEQNLELFICRYCGKLVSQHDRLCSECGKKTE